jgi:hypothetical protein
MPLNDINHHMPAPAPKVGIKPSLEWEEFRLARKRRSRPVAIERA